MYNYIYIYILLIAFTHFHLQIAPKRQYVSGTINGAFNVDNHQEIPASSLTSDGTWAMHYQMSVGITVILRFFRNFDLGNLQTN
jgi:hypothetical protein